MYSTNFGGARKGAGRPPKGTGKRIKVSFTLDKENKETLELIAKEKGISESDFINNLLKTLKNEKNEH